MLFSVLQFQGATARSAVQLASRSNYLKYYILPRPVQAMMKACLFRRRARQGCNKSVGQKYSVESVYGDKNMSQNQQNPLIKAIKEEKRRK